MSSFKVEDFASEIASLVSEKLNSMLGNITSEAKKNGHVVADSSVVEEEKESATSADYEDEVDFSSDAESEEKSSEAKYDEVSSERVSSSKATLSKSDLVRDCLKRHGGEIKNKDVIDEIKRDHGVEVTASLVSILKKAQTVRPKAKEGLKKREGEKKASGSSLIRAYLEKHGADSANEDVVRYVSKTAGVEVRPTLVSSVRANMKKKGLKKIGRPKSKKSTVKVVIESLKKGPKDGMNLSQVASRAWKSGCSYKGKKGFKGFSQNVYQTLHNLCNKAVKSGSKGKVALVIHEKVEGERFGRYKINPKAVRNQVA